MQLVCIFGTEEYLNICDMHCEIVEGKFRSNISGTCVKNRINILQMKKVGHKQHLNA